MRRQVRTTIRPLRVCGPILLLLLGLSTVLAGSRQDCEEQPVRLWLTGNVWIYAMFLANELLCELSTHNNIRQGRPSGGCESVRKMTVAGLGVIGGMWFLLGNIWVWSSWDCWEQWPSGYLSAVGLVLAYYAAMLGSWCWARKSVDRSCYMVLV